MITDQFDKWPPPREWTSEQVREAAEYLSKKTLPRLRIMQRVNKAQTAFAHKERKTEGLLNLQKMFYVYQKAVELRCFRDAINRNSLPTVYST